ncbi:MAG TPA: hypothetical protein VLL75_09555, partial [Vicinamibacteria bacterium]|nr:hypothetical protein [Vicinamibacteria bacterium]
MSQEARPAAVLSPADRSRFWTEWLAVATSACLVFLTLSGLSVWLLPFSVANQVLVFLHTAVGLAVTLPVSLYVFRHWRVYRTNQMTHLKLLG